MMYDRFTNYHHLNNLIWVWGANGLRDIPFDEAYAYEDYYPGPNYVDILGADIYHFDYEQDDYESLLKLANGKPIALTETGELPETGNFRRSAAMDLVYGLDELAVDRQYPRPRKKGV
jgi:mannan endo-1,4-beta-mannosidase